MKRQIAAGAETAGSASGDATMPAGGEARTVADVTDCLTGRGMVVVSCGREPGGALGAMATAGIGRSVRAPGSVSGAARGASRLWRVEAVGTFDDMRRALDALADSGAAAIPVAVAMDPPAPGQTLHRWSLWLVM